MTETKDTTFNYCFDFPDGTKKRFLIHIDNNDFTVRSNIQRPPEWTELGNCQCSCCRLDKDVTRLCPIAVNISDLITSFRDIVSHEACSVSCITAERTYTKNTIVQDGLSSILGIIMATSGCPTMNILKPMARFHLPFASVDEAMFRSVSVYLLRQYFIQQKGGNGDFSLSVMQKYYEQIEVVNKGILERIGQASKLDADKNAIVILNCMAQILNMEVDDNLTSLQSYFFPETGETKTE